MSLPMMGRLLALAPAVAAVAACLESQPSAPTGADFDPPRAPPSFDLTYERSLPLGERIQLRLYPNGYFTYTHTDSVASYTAEGNYYWAIADLGRQSDTLHLRFATFSGWEGTATIQDYSLLVQFTDEMGQIGFVGGEYHRVPNPTASFVDGKRRD